MRLRMVLIALGCIVTGWLLTSALQSYDEEFMEYGSVYDAASAGLLGDPTGFGTLAHVGEAQSGIIGGEADLATELDMGHGTTPSITGALSELHIAVKDKLHSWTPYRSKPNQPLTSDGRGNATSEGNPPATNTTTHRGGEHIQDGISEEERLGARTRIGKCTIVFNGNSFWERAIRTHERHDREHGYRMHVLRQHLMDDVWSKPAYILSLLLRELAKPENERLEWLFWVDADTVILNPFIPIDVFLPPPGSQFDDVHLMYSNDWNGLNNGVFPVRVNQWSVQLFSAITSFRHYRPEIGLQFRDQSAMDILMREPAFANNIVQAPQRWFNAYQGEHNETLAPFQIRRGDFLVHFAGVPGREQRMGYWLDRAEQRLDDWEIPVKSTSYLQEVRDFWNEQSAMRQQRKETAAATRLQAKEMVAKIDQQLDDYGDRLEEGSRIAIQKERSELFIMLETESSGGETVKVMEGMRKLEEAVPPLTAIIEEAQKSLLTSAHEAIFGGEKDVLEHHSGDGIGTAELQRVAEAVKLLKNLVMTPQEHWSRHDITAATDAVTQARAQLQEHAGTLQSTAPAVAAVQLTAGAGAGSAAAVPSLATDTGTAAGTTVADVAVAAAASAVAAEATAPPAPPQPVTGD